MTVTSPFGQVLRDGDGMRLEFVRSYDDPIDDVWSALTEPDRMARWFGRWTGDPTTGVVQLAMVEAPDASETVRILVCEPPTRLEVDVPSPDGTWRLSLTLTAGAGGTTLRFVHRLAEPYDAGSIGPGWHYYLDRLDAVVAGRPVPEDFDDYFPSLSERYGLPG